MLTNPNLRIAFVSSSSRHSALNLGHLNSSTLQHFPLQGHLHCFHCSILLLCAAELHGSGCSVHCSTAALRDYGKMQNVQMIPNLLPASIAPFSSRSPVKLISLEMKISGASIFCQSPLSLCSSSWQRGDLFKHKSVLFNKEVISGKIRL